MRSRFRTSRQVDDSEMLEAFFQDLYEDMVYDRYALYGAVEAAMRREKAAVKQRVAPKCRHPGHLRLWSWIKRSCRCSSAWLIRNSWLLRKWRDRRQARAAVSPFAADEDKVIEGSFVVIEDDHTSAQETGRWFTSR